MNSIGSLRASLLAIVLMVVGSDALAEPANDELFARLDADADHTLDATEVGGEHRRLFDRLVRRADKNDDRRLTLDEFNEGLTPSAPPKPIVEEPSDSNPAADALRLLLLKLDKNPDGMLTKAEAPAALADAFDQLARVVDQDENDRIIYRELVQAGRPATQAAVRIARRERWDVAAELRRIDAQQGEAAKRFDSPPNPRDALASPRRMEELFKRLDANGDDRLTADEFPEQYRNQLGRLVRGADRDSSGDLSLAELQSQGQRAVRLLAMADVRQDAMSKDAKKDIAKKDNAMMDAETPTTREPRQQVDGPAGSVPDPRRAIAAMDRNGDGMIQASEALGPLRRRFDRLDANADGQLDPRELRRAARQLQTNRADRVRDPGDGS